jgi:ubiquinone/menaquinone biosynthesis C-methylase UbiE
MSLGSEHRERRHLDPDERRKIEDPAKLLKLVDIFAGMNLADVGCGWGYFTMECARALTEGQVWAVDVSSAKLEAAKKNLKEKGLANVHCLLSQPTEIPLADGFADAAICAHVLHEVDQQLPFLTEVARIINGEGSLLLVDWKKGLAPNWGPPDKERVSESRARALLKQAGFTDMRLWDIYTFHYVIKAVKG